MTSRRHRPAIRAALALALACWVTLLAFMLLSPSASAPSSLVERVAGMAADLGVPTALAAPERVEFGLNVLAFVPVSLLGTLLWPRPTWRDWTAGAFAASFLVEVVQAVALDARSATHSDVVANTLGGLAGAVVGLALTHLTTGHEPPGGGSEGGADLPDRLSASQEDQLPG